MKLDQLLEVLGHARRDNLRVSGTHGVIEARLDGECHPHSREPTYQVTAEYLPAGGNSPTRVDQRGFRFSTVCCLCATVCMGEASVDHHVFAAINQRFA